MSTYNIVREFVYRYLNDHKTTGLPERSVHSTLCKRTRDTIKLPYDFSRHAFRGAHIKET